MHMHVFMVQGEDSTHMHMHVSMVQDGDRVHTRMHVSMAQHLCMLCTLCRVMLLRMHKQPPLVCYWAVEACDLVVFAITKQVSEFRVEKYRQV